MNAQKGSHPVVILVANACVTHAPMHSDDPIAQWIDLMEVVEALCPKWPAQDPVCEGLFLL
jgi:hypothetical protein